MNAFERMARLPQGGPTQEPSIQIPMEIRESALQGLTALCHWLKGYEAGAGTGFIPGHFELLMLLRQINGAIPVHRPAPPRADAAAERPPGCPGKHLGALTAPPEPKRRAKR